MLPAGEETTFSVNLPLACGPTCQVFLTFGAIFIALQFHPRIRIKFSQLYDYSTFSPSLGCLVRVRFPPSLLGLTQLVLVVVGHEMRMTVATPCKCSSRTLAILEQTRLKAKRMLRSGSRRHVSACPGIAPCRGRVPPIHARMAAVVPSQKVDLTYLTHPRTAIMPRGLRAPP